MSADKVALITGAAKRIGAHLATKLASEGYRVLIHYNASRSDAAALSARLRAGGGWAEILGADLSDSEATAALIADAREKAGAPITLLINNASLFEDDRVDSVTPASFHAHMAVNTLAPLLLTQAFAAQAENTQAETAQAETAQALVINIVDQRVKRLNPDFISYTASKVALWALTQTTAQALAPHIRVNAIGPGPTLGNVHQQEGDFDAEVAAVPMGKGPTLDELYDAVQFFIKTPSITGQFIALDGGQHLDWRTPDYGLGG